MCINEVKKVTLYISSYGVGDLQSIQLITQSNSAFLALNFIIIHCANEGILFLNLF